MKNITKGLKMELTDLFEKLAILFYKKVGPNETNPVISKLTTLFEKIDLKEIDKMVASAKKRVGSQLVTECKQAGRNEFEMLVNESISKDHWRKYCAAPLDKAVMKAKLKAGLIKIGAGNKTTRFVEVLDELERSVRKVDIKTKNNSIAGISIIFNGGKEKEKEAVENFMRDIKAFGKIKKTSGFGASCSQCGFEGGYSYILYLKNNLEKSIRVTYQSTVYCAH